VDWTARNEHLAELGWASYQDYLASPRWHKLKHEALRQAEHRCQLCDRDKRLHVHHRTYRRLGTDDEGRDLLVLCERCHGKFHGRGQGTTTGSGARPLKVLREPSPLQSESALGAARTAAAKAAAKVQRREEEQRRQAKAAERKRLAKQRDWRDERRLLKPNLVYREGVFDNR
jgi:hypothetical protein